MKIFMNKEALKDLILDTREIENLSERMSNLNTHFKMINWKLNQLMNYLSLEFKTIYEKPSIPEHNIIVKKPKAKKKK